MILAESRLREVLSEGQIVLDPMVPDEHIGAASIDLRLSNAFVDIHEVMETQSKAGVDPTIDLERYGFGPFSDLFGQRKEIPEGESYVLQQQRLVLGYTQERITMSDDYAALVEGKSSFARIGLMVHITAPFIDPGFNNHLQLELFNVGPAPIRLYPGKPICHLIVHTIDGTGSYSGQFQDD